MDEIELLRQLRDGLPGARDEQRDAARAALVEKLEASDRSTRWDRRAPAWRSSGTKLAVAGVGLAALLIALPIGIFGGSGEVQPAVGQVLRQAAAVAAAQERVAPGPGQYLFTRSKSAYLTFSSYLPAGERHPCTARNPCDMTGASEWSVMVPSEREAWISFDGSRKGRVREVTDKPRFVSEGQRAGWVEAGSPPLPRAGRVEDGALSGGGGFLDATDLPTDPAALRQLIEAREIPGVEGPPGEAETFVLIGDMLRETYLPPAIRAAIFQLTAELPGVELLGEVRDPVDRPGTGIAFTDRKRGTRQELIFDPKTSALLGERTSIVRSGAFGFKAPPGTPISYAAYLESKVVDSVGRGAPAGAGAIDTTVGCYARASLHVGTTIVHGADPIATCAELWREGVVDTRRRPSSPHLVACTAVNESAAQVFPGSGPAVCRRLGLVPLRAKLP